MAEKRIEMLPNDGDFLQEKADAISALMLQCCVPVQFDDHSRRLFFLNVVVNYADLVNRYCAQRDDRALKRVSTHEFQGVSHDINDVNPSTQALILERMNEPFFNYMRPIKNPKIAYFDYALEKKITELLDTEQMALLALQDIATGRTAKKKGDRQALIDRMRENQICKLQMDDLSEGLVSAVNVNFELNKLGSTGYERNRAELSLKLVEFAESCVPFRPDAVAIGMLLTDKPLLIHKLGISLGEDNRLN